MNYEQDEHLGVVISMLTAFYSGVETLWSGLDDRTKKLQEMFEAEKLKWDLATAEEFNKETANINKDTLGLLSDTRLKEMQSRKRILSTLIIGAGVLGLGIYFAIKKP